MRRLSLLLAFVLALPLLGVIGAWFVPSDEGGAHFIHLAATVLPGYVWESALLGLGVALGTAVLGGATAAAVTLFDFPGRRSLEWALLLPLAMPAYVLAYAATDALQFSGPLQRTLRAWTGAEGPLWPDVRSLPGAIVLFTLALYPYVYLLTRGALLERGVSLMEAARLLGAGLGRRVRDVALPLARPALAAGVALALMETLADVGVGSYFGLATFSTGIVKAWLTADDRVAAAQLATVLLASVALLLALERRAQGRLRYAAGRPGAAAGQEARPVVLRGRAVLLAWTVCGLPVLLGFLLPVASLLLQVLHEARHGGPEGLGGLPWARFLAWSQTSLLLAGGAALATVAVALPMAAALRTVGRRRAPGGGWAGRLTVPMIRLSALGYATPGAVIAVGLLGPLAALQAVSGGGALAGAATVLFTGSFAGLIYAYLVRFTGVALQSLEAGYARIPPSQDEAARLLGAGPARLFLGVHLPLLARSAGAAALLVFVDVMKELPATLVLRPFDGDTLAVIAYHFARDERLAEAALPSLAIVAVGLLPVILLSRALRRGG